VFCAGLTTDVQAAAAAGTRFVGGGLTIASSNVTPGAEASIFRVDLSVSQAPFETIGSTGSVTSTSAGTEAATITTVLEHRSSGWVVRAANADVLRK
jgi:hypothetical protein